MKKDEIKFLAASFLSWRLILFLFLFLGTAFFSLQGNFLGGRLDNYLKAPWFWSWLNFDGVHYLSIAYLGYEPLTYFYFPVFPFLAGAIANFFGRTFESIAFSGLLVSHLAFFAGIIGFWKLIRLDFSEKIAKFSILLLLLFPTSFYFASFYTESLFFALVVWSFYFARKRSWFLAGVLAGFSSATRILGLALFPALIAEYFIVRRPFKDSPLKVAGDLICLLLVPLGIVIYMIYLQRVTGDPLNFFHTVGLFGEQRSSSLVLLPQVFYRYFFKILPSLNYAYFPVVFSTFLEIGSAALFLVLSAISFFRLRLSYSVYLALGYLIPTLSGSFSSFPRYVLVLFPAFILLGEWLSKKGKYFPFMLYTIFLILLAIATALFTRGYWVA